MKKAIASKIPCHLKFTYLGSNSAAPAHGRHHTSQVLQIQDLQIMIDCGEATQLQMKRYGLKKNRLSHIFISHLHGDHFFGINWFAFYHAPKW